MGMTQAEGSGKGGRANAGGAGDEAASCVQSASERIDVVGIHRLNLLGCVRASHDAWSSIRRSNSRN